MFQEKEIAQSRPANTTANTIYTAPANTTTIIKSVIICNTTNQNREFRLFVDKDGTTFDESTALRWDFEVPKGGIHEIDLYMSIDNSQNGSPQGSIGFRSDGANALTITVYGAEIA